MNSKLVFLFLFCLFISACDLKNPIGLIAELWEEKPCMVLIPAGEFQMGSDIGEADEKPVHIVYVDAFYIDVYPVTNTDYKKFIDANSHSGAKTTYRENITMVTTWHFGKRMTTR